MVSWSAVHLFLEMSASKLSLQLLARIIHDWARCTLARSGKPRSSSVAGGMVLHGGVDNLLSWRNGKARWRKYPVNIRVKTSNVLIAYLSCLRTCPAALACALTSALNELTSSTINFFIPSIESSSSKPKSNFWLRSRVKSSSNSDKQFY